MQWTDVEEIAISLADKHPDVDPKWIRFTDLRDWVLALDGFAGPPEGCNERILEAIQMHWIDEIS